MVQTPCWIKTDRSVEEALTTEERAEICREDGSLHRLYQSLLAWPPVMLPADRFYRAVLHTADNPLGLYRAEFVATYVAILTNCAYARAHHGENFLNAAPSRSDAQAILNALEQGELEAGILTPEFRAMAVYTRKLSLSPGEMEESDVDDLRHAGMSEAQIVQINQVAASFNYWTRMINGLGITLGDEKIGIDPEKLAGIMAAQHPVGGR